MFVHNFKYALKTMLKTKSAIIWTFLFPLALGTFMYMSFGNIFEDDAIFKAIDVAVVKNTDNESFESMLDILSEDGEDKMLNVSYMSEEDAKKAVTDEDVSGIIYIDEPIKLSLLTSSYEGTVLKTIVDEYLKQEKVLTDIAVKNPANLEAALDNLVDSKSFIEKKTMSDGNQDVYTNYFYAIFAMSCLFASFGALEKICNIQANVSALGMRRCVSPNHKIITILAEFLSMLVVQFVIEVIVLIYFNIIGVDFGNKYLPMLGILFFGSCIGISIGIIVGTITKLNYNMKNGICILIGMVLSVMADLVAMGVKHSIENTLPIVNRINPAALIVDSFYALNIYDTYDRYILNMTTMGGLSILLLFISFLILRRNRYESV